MAIQINGKKVIHLGSMTIPIIKGDVGPEGKQGKQGIPGIDGKDGITPLRGIDYWTTEDKTEIINEIDNKVQNDLQEYYKKTETYNKEEIDNKISLIPKFDIEVVDKLPTSNISEATVYLVKSGEESNNLYTEYIYTNGKWEQLGTQKLDLSGFYNKDEINSMLATRDSKITALEEENRSQADRIKELEEEVEILSGDYKESTVEGETVAISDGLAKSKIKADINGNSYQETTEGYQAVDDSEIRNYTPTASGNYRIPFKPTKGEQYYFKLITDNPTVSTGNAITIMLYDLEGNSLGGISNVNNGALGNAVNTLYTATIGYDNVGYVGGYINYDGFKVAHKTIKGLLVSKTNSEVLEPYTNGVASPSTEYEQPIEVIDGIQLIDWKSKGTFENDTLSFSSSSAYAGINYDILELFKNNAGKTMYFDCESYDFSKANDGKLQIVYNNGSNVYTPILDKNTKKSEFTIPSDVSNIISARLNLTVNNSNTSGTTYSVSIVKPILSFTKTSTYLPYGHIGLIQRGINKLDKENNLELGVIGNKIGDDRILTASNTRIRTKKPIKVKPNTVHTISVNSEYLISVREYNSKGKIVSASTEWTKSNILTLTTTATTNSFDILFSRKDHSTITLEEIKWCQLVEGTDKPYEPYIEPIVHSIDLAGNSLAKGDNVEISVNGSVKANKIIKRYVFTGNEHMITSSRTDVKRYVAPTVFGEDKSVKDNARNDILCNYFKTLTPKGSDAGYLGLSKYNETGVMINLPLDTEFSTLELFKAWLKEKYDSGEPLYIDYVLANPTTIPLPSIEPITLFEGTNIFELVTNLGTTLAVTYKVSNKKKILNLEERISALESAVIGG